MSDIMYDEVPGYKKGSWKDYCSHNDVEIKGFFGDYRFLSNFFERDLRAYGKVWPSVENAYQAAKYSLPHWTTLLNCSPKESKKYSREHKLSSDEVLEWNKRRLSVMKELIFLKFSQDLQFRTLLLETGDKYLEELNNWWDSYWGVCDGIGENHLGKILMATREYWKFYNKIKEL